MSGTNNLPRKICLRETDANFFAAVDRPYKPGNGNFLRLMHLAPGGSVHQLKQGSQVFVYPREEFDPALDEAGESKLTDSQLFCERVFMSASWMGNLAIDPSVERVEDKIIPDPSNFVKV